MYDKFSLLNIIEESQKHLRVGYEMKYFVFILSVRLSGFEFGYQL